MRERGFFLPPLPIALYVAIGALAVIVGLSVALKVQTSRLGSVKAEYAGFVAQVKLKGEQAQKEKETKERQDKQNKERSDAENKRLRSANQSLADELRQSRTNSRLVSGAPATTLRPDLACFERTYLNRVLSDFVEGAAKLVEAGDADRIDLQTARDWAKGR